MTNLSSKWHDMTQQHKTIFSEIFQFFYRIFLEFFLELFSKKFSEIFSEIFFLNFFPKFFSEIFSQIFPNLAWNFFMSEKLSFFPTVRLTYFHRNFLWSSTIEDPWQRVDIGSSGHSNGHKGSENENGTEEMVSKSKHWNSKIRENKILA